jgi:DNA ligase-1
MSVLPPSNGLPSAFARFAEACDGARSTASKLAKRAVVAGYLRTLGKLEVGVAARFLAAQPFGASSGKSLVMGGALVVEAIRTVSGIERQRLNQAFREHGEIGEAISALWPDPPRGEDALVPLTLLEVQERFEEIGATGVQESKRAILVGMLRRCLPREAVYLTKIILGDMRTGVSEGVIEMGLSEAFGVKLEEIRRARLLVGDIDAVALLAFEGKLEQAEFRPFVPLGYMLAQPVMTAEEIVAALRGRAAIAEDKYDGIRAQLHVSTHPGPTGAQSAVRVELYSRGSGAVTYSFPDITGPVEAFVGGVAGTPGFVLDGEIVPMRVTAAGDLQTLPFGTLQKRLRRKVLSAKQLRENPCAFVAFDLLRADGALLLDVPLEKRRQRLEELFEQMKRGGQGLAFVLGPRVNVTTAEALEEAFTAARTRRNEGLVIKRLDSFYTPGRRGDAWMKLKSHLPTLDVVVVGAERGHGKRRDVLSDVTFAVRRGKGLVTIGKAYTGLTDAEIAALTERFIAETMEEHGRYRVVRPTLVLEVAFDQITRSERHTSGYALRFPRIVRIREDKRVEEIDTVERVEQVYRSPDNLAVGVEGEKRAEETADADQLRLF